MIRVQIPARALKNLDDKAGYESVEKLKLNLKLYANVLPQAKLEELRAIILSALKRRFRNHKEPKYSSLNKVFTEQELALFLRHVKSDKFRLLFKYQAYLGLRIGEVTKLHVSSKEAKKKIAVQLRIKKKRKTLRSAERMKPPATASSVPSLSLGCFTSTRAPILFRKKYF